MVPGSRTPPCYSLSLFLLSLCSTPLLYFVYSQLVCLLPVEVFKDYVFVQCLGPICSYWPGKLHLGSGKSRINTYIHKCKDLWVATLPFQLSTLKSTLKKPVYPIDDHVSRAFLCAMVSLIGCYRDALRLKTVSMILQKFILPQCFCFFH